MICPFVINIKEIHRDTVLCPSKSFIILRRVGNNCGRNGFILKSNNFTTFRLGKVCKDEQPVFGHRIYQSIELVDELSFDFLVTLVAKIDAYKQCHLKGLNYIKNVDIHAGLQFDTP